MSHLRKHLDSLYQIRFSPMCKPAAEVAGVTKLESHSTRARIMLMWRVAAGIVDWGPREVELIYQSTLDSISEAFDLFHYPVSQYMLSARADIWAAGLAPESVKRALQEGSALPEASQPSRTETLLLAGEIAQLNDSSLLAPIRQNLERIGLEAGSWIVGTGALAYALGAWNIARQQAYHVVDGLLSAGVRTVIADGPETAWALVKIYPSLGLKLPEEISVKLLSAVLLQQKSATGEDLGRVFVHDSRPASLIAERLANHLAILPGYLDDERVFGTGAVYEAPRQLLDNLGAKRVFGTWTRSLAKSSGADDGLWLTYPRLATALAQERLNFAEKLGAQLLVTDSPLAASFLHRHVGQRQLQVAFLPDLFSRSL